MARLIIIIFVVGIVWLLLRRFTARRRVPRKTKSLRFTSTVRCVRCGAYVDRRLARRDGDGYCCRDHEAEAP